MHPEAGGRGRTEPSGVHEGHLHAAAAWHGRGGYTLATGNLSLPWSEGPWPHAQGSEPAVQLEVGQAGSRGRLTLAPGAPVRV